MGKRGIWGLDEADFNQRSKPAQFHLFQFSCYLQIAFQGSVYRTFIRDG